MQCHSTTKTSTSPRFNSVNPLRGYGNRPWAHNEYCLGGIGPFPADGHFAHRKSLYERISLNKGRLIRIAAALALVLMFRSNGKIVFAQGIVSHTIQISSNADDGYYNEEDGSGWHSSPQSGGADLVGSWSGTTTAWVAGYRFPSTGINSGDTIRSAYLQLVSSDGDATSTTCGSAPCPASSSTFRVYGVAQDDGAAFSNTTGDTPISVPYTTSYVDYTTTGPGDVHGSCQGNNNGQNTCTHIIDVTNIVREITSRTGWTNTSAMRFVMLSTNVSAPNAYAGYEDSSANPAKAATLLVNPPVPTIVSSGAWGTGASETYPATYPVGPFVYPGASTLLLFLGDYYIFDGQSVSQPTVTDSCGNTWNIFAGPTDWMGFYYEMRSTVYFVQNPASCPGGDTITVTPGSTSNGEPIFLHFLAVAGSNTAQTPLASAITSPPSRHLHDECYYQFHHAEWCRTASELDIRRLRLATYIYSASRLSHRCKFDSNLSDRSHRECVVLWFLPEPILRFLRRMGGKPS